MTARFHERVLNWYDQHGRCDLPWQKNQTCYRVWVSEIMLQQTQVNTVIPYYQRFMKRFPSLKTLATANLNEVLTYWSGLGYYARGRHLHCTAIIVHEQYRGRFPSTIEGMQSLPGIGRSTAGAIISLARNTRAGILDANVRRVLTRFFGIDGLVTHQSTRDILWSLTDSLTPEQRCRDYNQAMMDIGALICTAKQPQCHRCPLQENCQAHATHQETSFPRTQKSSPHLRQQKHIFMLIFYDAAGRVLLIKRPPMGIWGGLWSFPECSDSEHIDTLCNQTYCLHYDQRLHTKVLPRFKHVFSHFDCWITPVKIRVTPSSRRTVMDLNTIIWYDPRQALPGGIPAPVTPLMSEIQAEALDEQHHS